MLNDPRVSCLVQEQFGEVRYRVIGDDSAPGFFSVSAESGQVSVSRSVQGDTEIQYRVSDHTSPPHTCHAVTSTFIRSCRAHVAHNYHMQV